MNLTNNKKPQVHTVISAFGGTVRQVKFTFSVANYNATINSGSLISVTSLFLFRNGLTGQTFLTKSGGTMYGNLDMNTSTYITVGNFAALPTASITYRGKIACVQGASGVADKFYICMKSTADTYAWELLKANTSNPYISFNGASSRGSLPPSIGDFTGNTQFVIEVKKKFTTVSDPTSLAILCKKDLTYSTNTLVKGWSIRISSAGKVVVEGCASNGGTVYNKIGATVLQRNTLYYIRVVYNDPDLKIYISTDGTNFTEDTAYTGTGTDAQVVAGFSIAEDSEVQLGRFYSGSGGYSQYTLGDIYYVKVWKGRVDTLRLPTHNYHFSNFDENNMVLVDSALGTNGQGYVLTKGY